jgi:N-acetylneuraminic acid mutarotase
VKPRIFLAIGAAYLLLMSSCSDVLSWALEEIPRPGPVSNFVSTVGDAQVALSWTNPADPDFSRVMILRKAGGFPGSPADAGATTVYDDAGASYLDTDVVVGTTYYYAAWSVNTSGEYSAYPARAVKSVAAFTETIRTRCFYLIGGSSDTADPFGNLVAGVDAFDPLTDMVYVGVTTLPVPRYSCAVASAHGKIYVFGGLDAARNLVSTVNVLDVLSPTWPSNVWTTATDMPFPRYALRAENVDDNIFVFGGSTSLSPWPWASMVDYNHRFDPISNSWITNEAEVPRLSNSFMNFTSGAFSGNLVYGVGQGYNQSSFYRYLYAHNIYGNHSTLINDGDIPVRAAPAGVLYYKAQSGSTDLFAFFIMGGCTDSGTSYEPLRTPGGLPLSTVSTCFYMKLPDTALDIVAMPTRSLNAARAYAQAETYGDSIYVFCGLIPTVTDSYEKLQVSELPSFPSFPSAWAQTTASGLNKRYAFDITKVNQ